MLDAGNQKALAIGQGFFIIIARRSKTDAAISLLKRDCFAATLLAMKESDTLTWIKQFCMLLEGKAVGHACNIIADMQMCQAILVDELG